MLRLSLICASGLLILGAADLSPTYANDILVQKLQRKVAQLERENRGLRRKLSGGKFPSYERRSSIGHSGSAFDDPGKSRGPRPLLTLPNPTPRRAWDGFYIGPQAGAGITRAKEVLSINSDGSGNRSAWLNANYAAGYLPGETGDVHDGRDFSPIAQRSAHLIYGAVLGYNARFSSGLVAGIEGDISGGNSRKSSAIGRVGHTQIICPVGLCNESQSVVDRTNGSIANSLPWLSTFRLRIGYAFDDFLVFGSFGAAITNLKKDLSIRTSTELYNCYSGRVADCYLNGGTFYSRDFVGSGRLLRDRLTVGYALSGGIERKMRENVFIRAEAMFLNFGASKEAIPYSQNTGIGMGAWYTLPAAKVRSSLTETVFRASLIYQP